MSKKTAKIGEAPPQTPSGVVYISAELIDDSAERFGERLKEKQEKES